jgi:hypothetical protein
MPLVEEKRGSRALFSLECQSAFQLTHFLIPESLEENCMTIEDSRSQTYVEKVLALLEAKFPWLGKEDDEQVSGADSSILVQDISRWPRMAIAYPVGESFQRYRR